MVRLQICRISKRLTEIFSRVLTMATRTYTETAIQSCDLGQKKASATVLGFRYGRSKTGTFYVPTNFRGRPIARRLTLCPNSDAVTVAHAADPNGAPRLTLRRICCTAVSVIESFTQSSHGSGRAAGTASIRGPRDGSTRRRAPDHHQSSARATMLAQTGLHSMSRNTVSSCASCSIGNALNRPCHTGPLDSRHW
jgi:hypothetical protein